MGALARGGYGGAVGPWGLRGSLGFGEDEVDDCRAGGAVGAGDAADGRGVEVGVVPGEVREAAGEDVARGGGADVEGSVLWAVADDRVADEEYAVAAVFEWASPHERCVVAVAEDWCGEVGLDVLKVLVVAGKGWDGEGGIQRVVGQDDVGAVFGDDGVNSYREHAGVG